MGTSHLLAREYDPGLGRFVSTDPVMNPADPQQLNPYANNSPVSKTDPDGLYATACDSCMTGPRSYRQVDRRGQWGLTYWSKSDARGRYGSRPAYYPSPRLVNYRGPNGGTNVVGGLAGSLAAALDAPAPGAWAVKKALGLPDDVAQQKADEFTGADRDDGKYKTEPRWRDAVVVERTS